MTKYFSQDSQQWRKKVFFFYIFDNLTGESRVENQKKYFQYNQPDLYIMSTSQNKKRVLNQISALSLLQQKNVTLKGHDERGFSLCVKDRRPTDGLVGKQGAFKISTEGFFYSILASMKHHKKILLARVVTAQPSEFERSRLDLL